MQRLILAVLFVAVVAGLIAAATKGLARVAERTGGSAALTEGNPMQKVAFFLLLCLIVYVSLSGAK